MTASFPHVEYDPEANAAYIYLKEIRSGGVAQTVCVDPIDIGGMVNLDLDDEGVIVGIEALDARGELPPELLTR